MSSLQNKLHSTVDVYEAKDFSALFKTLEGFSKEALTMHHELYEGYIKKLNECHEKLTLADRDSANHNYSMHRALQIDKNHNLNGVVLHELFFSNLTNDSTEPHADFKTIIERDYGSWEKYISDLKASAMSSRAGWAFTAYNYRDGKIHNFVIDQHDLHVPAFVKPLLVIDLWEHAYTMDYGKDKAKYIDAIMKIINWDVVSKRFEAALKSDPVC